MFNIYLNKNDFKKAAASWQRGLSARTPLEEGLV